ncbi:MAG TPA: nitroreductase/quinone reductase family protein [Acidimicrobiia bacterium]
MADTYEATAGKRLFSSFVGVLARLGVGNFALLTTTGRRSGRSRTVTIAPISEGGIDYLVSPYGESAWVRNLRADPEAKLRRGRSHREGRMIEETGGHPGLVQRYYQREAFARRFMDVPADPTIDDFVAAASRFPVFRVQDR